MLGKKGVSPVVGEILLIAIIISVMTTVAFAFISSPGPPARSAEIQVRLENAGAPPTDIIRVILEHRGGDAIGIPTGADDEFRVIGGYFAENPWDNVVPWDNWEFSGPDGGFELGENAVGYLRHDDAVIGIGDRIWITINDLYAEKLIFHETLSVENSMLW
jgi:flagellin-like protein